MVLAKTQIRSRDRGRQRAAREEDRAAQRLHRALLRRHAVEPGAVAPQGSGAAADDRARALEHPAPVHQVRDERGRRAGSRSSARASPRRYGDAQVIDDFSAIVNRGEKIVLVGRNGVGKTTLLKALLADAPGVPASPADLDAGTVRWGHEVSIGYFPQDHTGAIDEGHDGGRVAAPVRSRCARGRTSTGCSARCCSAARKA